MGPEMSRRAILVIEDNPDDQLLIKQALITAQVPYPIVFVRDTREAQDYLNTRQKIRNGLPILIILDLLLNNEDGLELLASFRKKPETHCIPVIVLTQSHHWAHLEKSYQLGANSFVSKDGTLSELNDKLSCLCEYWLKICQLPVA
jgi:CheY-like chemotaxis protein